MENNWGFKFSNSTICVFDKRYKNMTKTKKKNVKNVAYEKQLTQSSKGIRRNAEETWRTEKKKQTREAVRPAHYFWRSISKAADWFACSSFSFLPRNNFWWPRLPTPCCCREKKVQRGPVERGGCMPSLILKGLASLSYSKKRRWKSYLNGRKREFFFKKYQLNNGTS